MQDLNILKSEMAALKQALDKEQIVNDRLLRTVMRHKASWLNKFVIAEFIALPVLTLMIVGICCFFHISMWFAVAFFIMSLFDVLADLRTFRIPPKMFATSSMLEVRKLLLRQKKERFIHVCICLPFAIVWIIWLLNSIANASDPMATDHALNFAGVIGGIIGGIIGTIAVIIIYRKAQRTNDTLLDDTNS